MCNNGDILGRHNGVKSGALGCCLPDGLVRFGIIRRSFSFHLLLLNFMVCMSAYI